MTGVYTDIGYLEQDYLDQQYGSGLRLYSEGVQFHVVIDSEIQRGAQFEAAINSSKENGIQFEANINRQVERGIQFDSHIIDYKKENGIQFEGQINKENSYGIQFESNLIDKTSERGVQFNNSTLDYTKENGIQFEGQINKENSYGVQFDSHIIDKTIERGIQLESNIIDYKKILGNQFQAQINKENSYGVQFHAEINKEKAFGIQFKNEVDAYKSERGIQFLADINRGKVKAIEFLKNHYQSYQVTGYLEDPYGEDPYLTGYFGVRIPVQFEVVGLNNKPQGFQFRVHIADYPRTIAEQFQAQIVDTTEAFGVQFQTINTQPKSSGIQFHSEIIDKLKSYGVQFLGNLTKEKAFGIQFQPITQIGFGIQFLSTIYNTVYLRILHNFKSRGLLATNWLTNSQAVGDFDINNVNTDIIEEIWKSDDTVKSGIKLTCDVGAGQICYMDTLAILNHNMTVSANVVLLMSNDPTFVSGVESIALPARTENMYYISPELPTQGFRYFRFQIDDPTNQNNNITIGNIIFGAADIIQGENFTDEVDFEMVDYTDKINTEGFTNVSNSRALKRKLTLQFESIDYEKRNYEILRNVFTTYRTSLKNLWIPKPDPIDQDLTDRLAIFGKLVEVPKQRHNNKGRGADYVTFTVDLDESL